MIFELIVDSIMDLRIYRTYYVNNTNSFNRLLPSIEGLFKATIKVLRCIVLPFISLCSH